MSDASPGDPPQPGGTSNVSRQIAQLDAKVSSSTEQSTKSGGTRDSNRGPRSQPGDGSYLTERGGARPGDGAYLAANGSRPPPSNLDGKSNASMIKPANNKSGSAKFAPPAPNGAFEKTQDQARGRHPRQPKADAAKRADQVNGQAVPSGQHQLDPSAPVFTHLAGATSQMANPSLENHAITPASSSRSSSTPGRSGKNARRGRGAGSSNGQTSRNGVTEGSTSSSKSHHIAPPVSQRRAAFQQQTKLTSGEPGTEENAAQVGSAAAKVEQNKGKAPARRVKAKQPEKDDLVSRLIRGLGRKPFLECPICFNSITPAQPIWSCLPPTTPPGPDSPPNYLSSCYTPFHLSCIRDWANRSLAEETEKARQSGKEGEQVEWRCPGCQKRRKDKVGGYKCFCGKLSSPPTLGSSPHGCGEGCGRKRATCDHPCPLICHPGPCPPCQVALIVPCPSHHISITVKCASATSNTASMSPVCDEICNRQRECGNKDHTCELLCHFGDCAPCNDLEDVRCYCGEEIQDVACGWGRKNEMECARRPEDGVEEHWRGRYSCGRICEKKYDCGIHHCKEACHPHPLSSLPCPNSPLLVTHCPCGQTPLADLPNFPRKDCMSPIPTCKLPCPKTRPCGHTCPMPCHLGPCPPCNEEVTRPCRCGESVLTVPCEVMRERMERGEGELRCERICKALRNCGRHECSRVCCPLAWQRTAKGKKKNDEQIITGDDDLHTCPLTCGKLLSCGLHTCPKPDHKGACGRCLQASYDELICHCGHTVVYPPVACGMTISCLYPCARDRPACGHPKTPHTCHESPTCPPCPYLTTKPCACGKDPQVKNIRCSQTVISCGQTCGALLECGYHTCDKSCHTPGECPPCNQTCNKIKKICKHPCTTVCHAPAKCPESNPCQAIITQSCSCGNLQTRTSCGASTSNMVSKEMTTLACNSECKVKQRNARLADALGIKTEGRGDMDWSGELRAFASANYGFVKTVEGTFREFFSSTRKTMILPHMPIAKRTFVIDLADAYHLGRELIDQEPHRSVMIKRRVDTRIPHPLLSAVTSPPASKPALGGLANLRSTPITSGTIAGGSTGTGTGTGAWAKSTTASTTGWGSKPATAASLFANPAASAQSTAGTRSSGAPTPLGSNTPHVSRPVTPIAPVLQSTISAIAHPGQGVSGSGRNNTVASPERVSLGVRSAAAERTRVGEVDDDDWERSDTEGN